MTVFDARWRLGVFLAVGSLCATGCSRHLPAWGVVNGHVRLHGQPVNEGTIIFENRELGVKRMAPIQSDGSYSEGSAGFAGLPVGKYRVAIGPQKISAGDFIPAAPPKPGKVPTVIPEKYSSAETSGLTAEVKEGANPPFDFPLEP